MKSYGDRMASRSDHHGAPANAPVLAIGGELPIRRLGFGAMRLPGAHDSNVAPGAAGALLREALGLGVTLIDTAWAYGRSEALVAGALHPYPPDVVIATKGGLAPGGVPDGRPERLRRDCEDSLRRLKRDVLDVWQLHRIDPVVPLEEQLGAVRDLRDEGKIRFVGLSEVSCDQLRRAQAIVPIATVQNRFNVAERAAADVLAACEADGIAFLPWAPVRFDHVQVTAAVTGVATRLGATPTQVAIAWLLQHSPVIVPIPGTASIDHLRENMAAADLSLSASDVAALDSAAAAPAGSEAAAGG